MNQINDFVDSLASSEISNCVFNHYSHKHSENEIRRNNLILYLNGIKKLNPETILVGESPGYQGCRLTGIPFTSEYLLLNSKDILIYGKDKGYKKTNEKDFEKKWEDNTFYAQLRNFYHKYVTKKKMEAIWWDQLYYREMHKLHQLIKERLKMETRDYEHRYWVGVHR